MGKTSLFGKINLINNQPYALLTTPYNLGKRFEKSNCKQLIMNEQRIKHVSIELKVIKLDLERISARLEDTNRSIKEILADKELKSRIKDLKELINFNRFLLQKHKEKIGDKHQMENRLKTFIQEENQLEFRLVEDEKRMEYFMLTLDNSLEFNSVHPFFNDPLFTSDLLNELLKREEYEKCAFLKDHLENLETSLA